MALTYLSSKFIFADADKSYMVVFTGTHGNLQSETFSRTVTTNWRRLGRASHPYGSANKTKARQVIEAYVR